MLKLIQHSFCNEIEILQLVTATPVEVPAVGLQPEITLSISNRILYSYFP
jgi:hypothetical protein